MGWWAGGHQHLEPVGSCGGHLEDHPESGGPVHFLPRVALASPVPQGITPPTGPGHRLPPCCLPKGVPGSCQADQEGGWPLPADTQQAWCRGGSCVLNPRHRHAPTTHTHQDTHTPAGSPETPRHSQGLRQRAHKDLAWQASHRPPDNPAQMHTAPTMLTHPQGHSFLPGCPLPAPAAAPPPQAGGPAAGCGFLGNAVTVAASQCLRDLHQVPDKPPGACLALRLQVAMGWRQKRCLVAEGAPVSLGWALRSQRRGPAHPSNPGSPKLCPPILLAPPTPSPALRALSPRAVPKGRTPSRDTCFPGNKNSERREQKEKAGLGARLPERRRGGVPARSGGRAPWGRAQGLRARD